MRRRPPPPRIAGRSALRAVDPEKPRQALRFAPFSPHTPAPPACLEGGCRWGGRGLTAARSGRGTTLRCGACPLTIVWLSRHYLLFALSPSSLAPNLITIRHDLHTRVLSIDVSSRHAGYCVVNCLSKKVLEAGVVDLGEGMGQQVATHVVDFFKEVGRAAVR